MMTSSSSVKERNIMVGFEWDGEKYYLTREQANYAYNKDATIQLPSGVFLQPGGWLESLPPQPCDMEPVEACAGYVLAVKQD
jgi:hypothetical protein